MKEISQLNDLMLELLENNMNPKTMDITSRGHEIIDEIADYAESTRLFQENKERGEIFDGLTARQVFAYMLDRVVNAPTTIHRNSSVILIMPFARQKMREEKEPQ